MMLSCALAIAERWQTLIGALIALVAAFVALRPVYGQLRAANLQAAVAMRGALADKIQLLETRRDKIEIRAEKMLTELLEHERIEHSKISHWAWEMETKVYEFKEFLNRMVEDKIETDQAGVSLSFLTKAAASLAECMFDVNLEQHMDIGHAEFTDADNKREVDAERELGDKITEVRLKNANLKEAYLVILDELRLKIRSLDQSINKQTGLL